MRQFMKQQPAVWVFLTALILLVLTAIVADKIAASYRRSVGMVTHTREVELNVSRARLALARAELVLLEQQIPEDKRRQSYENQLREVRNQVDQIRVLTSDNTRHRTSLDTLDREVNELRDGVETVFLTPPTPEALAFADSQFQRAGDQLQKMRIEEESLLAGRIEVSEAEYRRMLTFFRACFGFAALVLLWSSFDILRQTARTARAEKLVTSLNVRLQNAHDEEGKRIGRDLHDSVGQLLAAARIASSRIEATQNLPEDAREQAGLAMEATNEAIREIRTISYVLHPPMLDELGFVAAAQWFVRGFSERSGIEVNLDLPEDSRKLEPEVALALFRALQVSLSNVHRHSGSKLAKVGLRWNAKEVCLEVSDFGAGMAADRLELVQRQPAAAGVGLGGLSERVRQLHGDLEIASDAHGTRLRVRLPSAGLRPPQRSKIEA